MAPTLLRAPFVISGCAGPGLELWWGALEDSLMAGLPIRIADCPMALTGGKTCRGNIICFHARMPTAYALRSSQARTRLTGVPFQGRDRAGGMKSGKKTILSDAKTITRRSETTMEIWEKLPSVLQERRTSCTAGNAAYCGWRGPVVVIERK